MLILFLCKDNYEQRDIKVITKLNKVDGPLFLEISVLDFKTLVFEQEARKLQQVLTKAKKDFKTCSF